MEQYFTKKPSSERIDRILNVTFAGREFTFTASSGVFSRNRLDFGTELLINTLIEAEKDIKGKVLDLGCGYGPIGIILAALNPSAGITMSDINERAVELAKANSTACGTKNAEVVQSDGFESINGNFDIITTNPPIRIGKVNVTALIGSASGHMLPGARFYAVIGKKQGAESYLKIIASIFGNCEILRKKAGYHVLYAEKC